jgi:hypothetical protein
VDGAGLGFRGRSSRYEWDVFDNAGNRVPDIVKRRGGFRGTSQEVALTDGTPTGRAKPAKRVQPIGDVTFLGRDEAPSEARSPPSVTVAPIPP